MKRISVDGWSEVDSTRFCDSIKECLVYFIMKSANLGMGVDMKLIYLSNHGEEEKYTLKLSYH